jgi:hypothetical protein
MKKLLLSGAVAVALLPAAPASAASHKKLFSCGNGGAAPAASVIRARSVSCADARIVIRSVEAHAQFCKPYRQATIAPFRTCDVTVALSTGDRTFHCVARWLNARYWREKCSSRAGSSRVYYHRDGNAVTR